MTPVRLLVPAAPHRGALFLLTALPLAESAVLLALPALAHRMFTLNVGRLTFDKDAA